MVLASLLYELHNNVCEASIHQQSTIRYLMTKNIWPKSFNVAGTDLIPVKVKPSYKPHSVYLVKRSKLLDSKL